jgi:integrase
MRDGMIARGLAPATIKNALSLLSAAFNLSSRHGLWDGPNPANAKTGVQYPKLDNNGERYLTPEEAKMLLAELEAQSSWWHNATLLALCTGVRRTEIYRMRADDLDAEAGVIMLRSKLGLREPLLLTPRAIMVLEDRIRSRPRPDGLVFGQKNSRAFRETVKKLGFNAGVTERRRRVWFHILRHTFASWLFMTGTDIYVVQRLMRHSSIAMTQRYAHLGADTQREGLKSIVSLLATKA